MSKGYDSISAALGTVFVKQEEETPVLATVKEREVVAVVREYKESVVQTKETISKNFSEDYDFIRETLKDLMINGKDALVVATNLAEETESPRAYEVCTSIITTIAGLGKELVNLHKDASKMIEPTNSNTIVAENVTNVQNNYYNPNPKELQNILDQVEEVQYDDSDLE